LTEKWQEIPLDGKVKKIEIKSKRGRVSRFADKEKGDGALLNSKKKKR